MEKQSHSLRVVVTATRAEPIHTQENSENLATLMPSGLREFPYEGFNYVN